MSLDIYHATAMTTAENTCMIVYEWYQSLAWYHV